MGSDADSVESVADLLFASTTSNVMCVGRAVALLFASTTSNAKRVGRAVALLFASTTSNAALVGCATPLVFASTTRIAAYAPNVRTYHAPWKGVHSSVTASAAHSIY